MKRVYNFSAGPSMLPESVLTIAAGEMLSYKNSGQSVMEMSHRSKDYAPIIEGCEALLREVMEIPNNYKVLFMQGGASSQFSMIPLNLMQGSGKADYIVSGQFSKKAYQEAARYGDVKAVASSEDKKFSYIPKTNENDFRDDADYVHICLNNTIFGTRFTELPPCGDKVLVADASSCILSEPIDVSKFGVIYAGAQKNMAPAGLTVVIIREDLMGKANEHTPAMFNYKLISDNDSMYNTPSTYSIYMCGLVLEWIKNLGGLSAMKKMNEEKAAILYDFLDESNLFKGTANKADRSLMNVTFVTGNDDLDSKFVSEAKERGFVNLKGHRSVGGMRASIYNAMPKQGIAELVEFMKEFEAANS